MSASQETEKGTATVTKNRIDVIFEAKKAAGEPTFIFFLTAGHPDVESTLEAVAALEEAGADLIELGIPFSDPAADGPAIQDASLVALRNGMSAKGAIDIVRKIRETSEIPLVFFTAYNPVFRYGEAQFVRDAAEAGIDGMLVPDLPPDEAEDLIALCRESNLKLPFLAAPTTNDARRRLIAEKSTGFIYYVSLRGVTGARERLPEDMERNVTALKNETDLPIAVGFGISKPEQAAQVGRIADGVVVGSALVLQIGESAGKSNFRETIRSFASNLVQGTKS